MLTCIFCSSVSRVSLYRSDTPGGKDNIQLLKQFGVVVVNHEIHTCRQCWRRISNMLNRISLFQVFCQKAGRHIQQQSKFISHTAISSSPQVAVFNTLAGSPQLQRRHTSMHNYASGMLCNTSPDSPHTAPSPHLQQRHIIPTNANRTQPVIPDTTPSKTAPNNEKKRNAAKRVLYAGNNEHNYNASEASKDQQKKKRKKVSTHKTVPMLHAIAASAQNQASVFLPAHQYDALHKSINTRDVNSVIDAIQENPQLMDELNRRMMTGIDNTASKMGNRKHGEISTLMLKDHNCLKEFTWANVVREGCEQFPVLVGMLLHLSMGKTRMMDDGHVESFIPKLGLILGILLQSRHHELSLVQRAVSVLLFDSISDQKVYDRLQPLGVCLCHETTTDLLETIGESCHHELVQIVKNQKRIRLVGDNVNYMSGVAEERQGKHSHLVHAFGSLAIEQPLSFEQLDSSSRPPFYKIDPSIYILNERDWMSVRAEYVELIARVAGRIIPCFPHREKPIVGPYTLSLSKKNKIVPLALLFRNEQKYSDVVEILDFYEATVKQVYEEAGVPLEGSVLIGGDQLTRERFSGAKRLRIGGADDSEKFEHLGPITFELFHLMMNFLILIFKRLYKDDTMSEIGTIMCEKVRINRNNVSENVRESYSADKDFFLSLVDSYIVEAILTHFGMETTNDVPTKNTYDDKSTITREAWLQKEYEAVVDEYIAPSMQETLENLHNLNDIEVDGQAITIATKNNVVIDVLVKPKAVTNEVDEVCNHAKYMLELGMLFKSMLDLIHFPDRDRGLRLLKYVMLVFRSDNTRSKYAYEIMRLLVHQYVVLSEQEAHQEFYSLFVNTNGKVGGNVAVDYRMEGHVDLLKQHINHMVSNKTDRNITNKTRALGVVKDIAESFDSSTSTRIRSRKHMVASSSEDEQTLVKDLRSIRPFHHCPGRSQAGLHLQYPSQLKNIDVKNIHQWISDKNYEYATEQGN